VRDTPPPLTHLLHHGALLRAAQALSQHHEPVLCQLLVADCTALGPPGF